MTSGVVEQVRGDEYPLYGFCMYQKMDRLEMLVIPMKIDTEQELRDLSSNNDNRPNDVLAMYPNTGNIAKMLDFYRYAKECKCSITIPPNPDDPWSRIVSIPVLFGNPRMFWENYLRLNMDDYSSVTRAWGDGIIDMKK